MSLKILRPEDGVMMKLVKYDAIDTYGDAEAQAVTLAHNHTLTDPTENIEYSHAGFTVTSDGTVTKA